MLAINVGECFLCTMVGVAVAFGFMALLDDRRG